jgi:hypothetical protein
VVVTATSVVLPGPPVMVGIVVTAVASLVLAEPAPRPASGYGDRVPLEVVVVATTPLPVTVLPTPALEVDKVLLDETSTGPFPVKGVSPVEDRITVLEEGIELLDEVVLEEGMVLLDEVIEEEAVTKIESLL